jgi:hypothetical protein
MLNQICPYNFEETKRKLCEFLIADAERLYEPGFDQKKAENIKIDEEKCMIVVKAIFQQALE